MAKKPTVYRTYSFKDRDPILDRIQAARDGSDMTTADISEISGISTTTLYNWRRRKTRRPQYCTVIAALRTFGVDLKETPYSLRKNGNK